MMQTTVPNLSPKPLVSIRASRGWAALELAEAWHFRDLLFGLAGRDVRLRYRQTLFGAVWVVLQPLMTAGIFVFVFGIIAKLGSDFPLCYTGMIAWTAFSTVLTKSSASLVGNSQLISKIYFPRIILPLSTVPSALIDFGVACAILAIIFPVWQVAPGLRVALLPLWLLLILLLAIGVGLVASSFTVSYRDVQYILPVMVQILLYASPVGYAASRVPASFRSIYYLNPLTSLLEAFRWSLLGNAGGELHGGYLAYSAACCLACFLLGLICFKNMERRFADVI